MEFANKIGSMLEKLQGVYSEGAQLQQKHDDILQKAVEEVENLKLQLSTNKLELAESKLELKSEMEKHKQTKQSLLEAQSILDYELEERAEREKHLQSIQTKLKYAKIEIIEKDLQIRELEQHLLNEEVDEAEETSIDGGNLSDGDGDFSVERSSSSEAKRHLYSIPEENPDEIPDYYEACINYAESLKIVIGSDSSNSKLSFSDSDDKGVDGTKQLKINFDSKPTEKATKKANKKRKQFKVLFCLANY